MVYLFIVKLPAAVASPAFFFFLRFRFFLAAELDEVEAPRSVATTSEDDAPELMEGFINIGVRHLLLRRHSGSVHYFSARHPFVNRVPCRCSEGGVERCLPASVGSMGHSQGTVCMNSGWPRSLIHAIG